MSSGTLSDSTTTTNHKNNGAQANYIFLILHSKEEQKEGSLHYVTKSTHSKLINPKTSIHEDES